VFSGTDRADPTPFRVFETHPLGDAGGAWSPGRPFTGDLPADAIDAFVVRHGADYVCAYKNRATHTLEFATAPALTGPYTVRHRETHWGMQEGPVLLGLRDGRWRLFFDWPDDAPANYRWVDSLGDDPLASGWTTPAVVASDIPLRHGTMARLADDDLERMLRAWATRHA
jgi:hypothetical protein